MKEADETTVPQKKSAEALKEVTDKLEKGIQDLYSSDKYKEYLSVMSKFYHYSINNTILIAIQKPDATLVAGYSAWEKKFKRFVRKGERGIKILAPCPYTIKKEVPKMDSQTQTPMRDENGKIIMEQIAVTIPTYKVVSVFDVSQTDGKELPSIAVDALTGKVERYDDFFKALTETAAIPVGFEKLRPELHGYYSVTDKSIVLAEGMSELQTLKTFIHEIAHSMLHGKEGEEHYIDRSTKEVQAESVAYTVCQHYGLDTSDYSFGYIAGWSQTKGLDELKDSLSVIHKTAQTIIDCVDKKVMEIQKGREAELPISADRPEAFPDSQKTAIDKLSIREQLKNSIKPAVPQRQPAKERNMAIER